MITFDAPSCVRTSSVNVGLQELVEAEVVAEVLARRRCDRQPQPELVGVGLVVAQLEQLFEAAAVIDDDRLGWQPVACAGLAANASRGLTTGAGYRRRP